MKPMRLTLHLVDADTAELVDTYEDVEEMDLTKPLAAADLLDWLKTATERHRRRKAESGP